MILRQSILSLLFAAFVFAQNPFASNTRIPVGAGPASIAVSDFNGDGKKDLAVANKTDKNISVLLGNGAGGFANAPGSPLLMDPDGYGGPGLITAGDFNGDGKLDILYADDRFFQLGPMSYASGPTLAIRLGNGDGTFAPSLGPLASVSSQWARMRSADVNGDGKLDVIGDGPGTGSTSPVLNGSYLNGDGTGHFTRISGTAVGSELADFNHDGRLDYAATGIPNGTYFAPLVIGPKSIWFSTGLASEATLRTGSLPASQDARSTSSTQELRVPTRDLIKSISGSHSQSAALEPWKSSWP